MLNRKKIHAVNPWRDPPSSRKDLDYLSPHCQNAACNWCRERARRKKEAATAALEATLSPGLFWESKITRGNESDQQLGPSTLWAKPAEGRRLIMDVLGFWS